MTPDFVIGLIVGAGLGGLVLGFIGLSVGAYGAVEKGYELGLKEGRRLEAKSFDAALVAAQVEARKAAITGTVTLPLAETPAHKPHPPLTPDEVRRILATTPLPPKSPPWNRPEEGV